MEVAICGCEVELRDSPWVRVVRKIGEGIADILFGDGHGSQVLKR